MYINEVTDGVEELFWGNSKLSLWSASSYMFILHDIIVNLFGFLNIL
jgi:hypothetical protein